MYIIPRKKEKMSRVFQRAKSQISVRQKDKIKKTENWRVEEHESGLNIIYSTCVERRSKRY